MDHKGDTDLTLPHRTLVIGGAASGKSRLAEGLVTGTGAPRVYIATAQAFDAEMEAKIAAHKVQRGTGWTTLEAPLDIAAPLARCTPDQVALLDCATLWLSNMMLQKEDVTDHSSCFTSALADCPARVIIVSNETGQGIVPDTPLGRRFRNAQGTLNQALAATCDLVVGVMAGLPVVLKGTHPALGSARWTGL